MPMRRGQRVKPPDQVKERIISVRITAKQHAKLKKLGRKEDRSMSYLLAKAVEQYLSKQ